MELNEKNFPEGETPLWVHILDLRETVVRQEQAIANLRRENQTLRQSLGIARYRDEWGYE